MDKFIDMFLQDPFKATSIFAVILIGWFIKREHKLRDKQFESFQTQIEAWKSQIALISDDFVRTAREHQESMGLSSVAINKDMVSIRRYFFELTQRVEAEVEGLKAYISELENRSEGLSLNLTAATQDFDVKFGKILDLREKLDHNIGRVIHIEEGLGKNTIETRRHTDQIAKIARILEHQRQKELDAEKGKK